MDSRDSRNTGRFSARPPTLPTTDSLAPLLRRLPPYIYLADLFRGRRILEIGCGDGAAAKYLAQSGAAQVVGLDRSGTLIDLARTRHRLANLSFRPADYGALEVEDRTFDVVCVPNAADLIRWLGFLEEVRRVLAKGGNVIVGTPSADRPEARGGISYHELVGRLTPLWGPIRVVGVTPFVGFSLVEFADEEEIAELDLDTSLASLGSGRDPITEYVAIAGPMTGPPRGFLVVEIPPAEGLEAVAMSRGAASGETPRLEARLREAEAAHADAISRLREVEQSLADVHKRSARADDVELRRRLARAVEERTAAETEIHVLRSRVEQAEEEIGKITAQAALELDEARREARTALERALEAEGRVVQSEGRLHLTEQRLAQATAAAAEEGRRSLEDRIQRLEVDLRERESELARARAEQQEAQWRAGELEGRVRAAEQRLAEVEQHDRDLDRRREEAEKRRAEAETRCAEALRQLEAVSASPRLRPEMMAQAGARHEEEMRALRTQLEERDAYADELQREIDDLQKVAADARAERARLARLEVENRALRDRVSVLEGRTLRAFGGAATMQRPQTPVPAQSPSPAAAAAAAPAAVASPSLAAAATAAIEAAAATVRPIDAPLAVSAGGVPSPTDGGTEADVRQPDTHEPAELPRVPHTPSDPTLVFRIAELEQQVADKQTSLDKASERWRAAESKTDELWRKIGEMQREIETSREQSVENARMQRQAAQIALTRAMDEASRKLVSVKDELGRTARERDELERTKAALQQDLREAQDRLAALEAQQAQGGRAREALVRIEERAAAALATIHAVDEALIEEERRLEGIETGIRSLAAFAGSPPEAPAGGEPPPVPPETPPVPDVDTGWSPPEGAP